MTGNCNKKNKPRYDQRFDREAKALQKNLAKRKQQQKKLEELKKEKTNGQD